MTDPNPYSIAAPAEAAEQGIKIAGFLCNWCSYGGADTAGVCRFKQPTDLRIVRIPCTGRMDPLFVAKSLIYGVDGVLVSGCHPKDCHYAVGNLYARRRLEVLKSFLSFMGIDARRFHYTWVSASEGQRWQQVVTEFSQQIHRLGPNPGVRKQPGENLKLLDGQKEALIP
jgi:coenzyme F420-reducing hydrogenase delta subunit